MPAPPAFVAAAAAASAATSIATAVTTITALAAASLATFVPTASATSLNASSVSSSRQLLLLPRLSHRVSQGRDPGQWSATRRMGRGECRRDRGQPLSKAG